MRPHIIICPIFNVFSLPAMNELLKEQNYIFCVALALSNNALLALYYSIDTSLNQEPMSNRILRAFYLYHCFKEGLWKLFLLSFQGDLSTIQLKDSLLLSEQWWYSLFSSLFSFWKTYYPWFWTESPRYLPRIRLETKTAMREDLAGYYAFLKEVCLLSLSVKCL